MNRLDQIEASMEDAKAWAAQGDKHRTGGRTKADDQLVKLARTLAEATEDTELIAQTQRIVDIYNSF